MFVSRYTCRFVCKDFYASLTCFIPSRRRLQAQLTITPFAAGYRGYRDHERKPPLAGTGTPHSLSAAWQVVIFHPPFCCRSNSDFASPTSPRSGTRIAPASRAWVGGFPRNTRSEYSFCSGRRSSGIASLAAYWQMKRRRESALWFSKDPWMIEAW